MNTTLIVTFNAPFAPRITAIRRAVFTGEQGIDTAKDFDGQDPRAVHALVMVDDGYVGTGRMLADGHIGRLAVLAPHRGKGLGARLVRALGEEARRKGLRRVYLGAQKQAQGFYERLGFATCGKTYLEVGIAHVPMEWLL